MSTAKEAKAIIDTLKIQHFYAACPCCEGDFLLRDAGLFYLNEFTPQAEQLYQQRLQELKERDKELRIKRKRMSETSEVGAQKVNIGNILEQIAPSMKAFPFSCNDCRSLFKPIDYIVFNNLCKNNVVDKIMFVEIKTGKARLSRMEHEILSAVERKRVSWDTYKMEAGI